MKLALPGALVLILASPAVPAHHGVASLVAAAIEGPGAPVETSSSVTLPTGRWLVYLKADHAKSETYDASTAPGDQENDYNQYWLLGLGHALEPWLSLYVFQPYNIKRDEYGDTDSAGFTDVSLMGVIGFKYDDGWMRVPADESLDDLMDWHFTVYGGLSLPTGDANHRLDDGSIDPGKALGFGKPSFSYGVTATRQFSDNATLVFEAGQTRFQEYRYDDGNTVIFGRETRLNSALSYRLTTRPDQKFRLDGNVEFNYLQLGRDIENGLKAAATGGHMIYGVLGGRVYLDTLSLGLAVKKPIWIDLDEEAQQQGAEGREKYRFIATFSALF